MEDTATLKAKWHEPEYDGQIGIEDKQARLALSTYAHYNFQSKSLCAMKRYQHRQYNIQQRYFVWPLFEEQNAGNTITFPLHGRCNCQHMKDFDSKCEHELKVNHSLVLLGKTKGG